MAAFRSVGMAEEWKAEQSYRRHDVILPWGEKPSAPGSPSI